MICSVEFSLIDNIDRYTLQRCFRIQFRAEERDDRISHTWCKFHEAENEKAERKNERPKQRNRYSIGSDSDTETSGSSSSRSRGYKKSNRKSHRSSRTKPEQSKKRREGKQRRRSTSPSIPCPTILDPTADRLAV
jgi:hypothetical protein